MNDYGNVLLDGQISFNGSARMARWRLDQVVNTDRFACGTSYETKWVYRPRVGVVRKTIIDNRVVREDLEPLTFTSYGAN